MAARMDGSPASPAAIGSPGPIRRLEASRFSLRSSGSTAAILTSALRAASPSGASARSDTQREPSTSASISSSVNISGGSMNADRIGKHGAAHRPAMTAQHLNELKQASGAGHGGKLP